MLINSRKIEPSRGKQDHIRESSKSRTIFISDIFKEIVIHTYIDIHRYTYRYIIKMVVMYKPSFVKHDANAPIFSIDAHRDSTRFATAGGDQKVKIWSSKCLLNRAMENDCAEPKLLCTIQDHFGPVNCCRFSRNGKYLATASTDSNVLLYELGKGKGKQTFGSTDQPNVENWVNVGKLRGHSSDVIDIAFSPDDKYLASASFDNLVCVWDVEQRQIVATLKGHKSLVKGVAWDPIGKFLSSQGDDKAVIIWRVDDWEKVATITEPYKQSVGATFSMRLCWSPDGKAVTTCNAYKKPSHTASVLERGEWDSKFDFVGHKGPVVAVRFSPGLFKKESSNNSMTTTMTATDNNNNNNNKPKLHTVVACGSQDTKLTIWATNRPKPVCVIKSCFEQSVVDLSWTPDGYSLLACSTDGTVAVFTFEEAEIGCRVSELETEQFFRDTYGSMIGQKKISVLEDPTMVKYAKKQNQANNNTTTTMSNNNKIETIDLTNNNNNGKNSALPQRITAPQQTNIVQQAPIRQQQQQETIASDGRRRIMPMAQQNNENQQFNDGASVVGVKRVAPQAISGGNEPKRLAPMPISGGGSGGQPQRIQPIPTGGQQQQQQQAPVRVGPVPISGGGVGGSTMNNNNNNALLTPPPKQQAVVQVSQQAQQQSQQQQQQQQQQTRSVQQQQQQSISQIIPIAPIPQTLHVKIVTEDAMVQNSFEDQENVSAAPVILECKNDFQRNASEIVCSRSGDELWTDRLDAKCSHITGNSKYSCIALEDGSLQIYTDSGRRQLPTIALEGGKVCFLACVNNSKREDNNGNNSSAETKLLVVTTDASLYVWDLEKDNERCVLESSIASICFNRRDGARISRVSLSEKNLPLVTLSNGVAYAFHEKLKAWAKVADTSFQKSEYVSRLRLGVDADGSSGEVRRLQTSAARLAIGTMASSSMRSSFQTPKRESGRHLEQILQSCKVLGSEKEFKTWLQTYATHLASEFGGTDQRTHFSGAEKQLRELCAELLGSLSKSDEEFEENDDGFILGMRRRDLLRDVVIPALAREGSCQSVVTETIELLENTKKK